MELFIRIRKPIISLTSRLIEAVIGIILLYMAYPILVYIITGQWIQLPTLIMKAIAEEKWIVVLALHIPVIGIILATISVISGIRIFIKDVRKTLKPQM